MHCWRVIGLLVMAMATAGCHSVWKWRMPRPIASTGGRVLHVRLQDVDKTLMQQDRRWASDRLGHSDCTIGSHGCLVSSVAMACTNLGVKLSPKELNERLKRGNGFLPQGWMVWNALAEATDARLMADYYRKPDHRVMDEALECGAYPVVKFFLPGGHQHWCLVVGKDGQDYLARDPLRDDVAPVKLCGLTARIHSVRVIRAAQPDDEDGNAW